MIDKVLLFPYWFALKLRHFMFDKGIRKVSTPDVPSICIGNITVGGTGKTPHTEMILRTLLNDENWGNKNLAVLSRGYKRSTKGFQQVITDGTADEYGEYAIGSPTVEMWMSSWNELYPDYKIYNSADSEG